MPTLYVTEPGAVVRLTGESLLVTLDTPPDGGSKAPSSRAELMKVALHRLEMVGLVGRVHLTLDALQACLAAGIGVAWFGWNGRFLGRLVPPEARSGDLRLLQYQMAVDGPTALAWARVVVAGKCANAAAVLRGIQANYPGLTEVASAIATLGDWRQRTFDCDHPEQLLGMEGSAAACYFGALDAGFRGEIGFPGRKRRPPPDPANALLSFGYVLLGNWIGGVVEGRGLDPAVGFFHALRPGRPSLALDLLEEFRHPVVDRFVMRVLNLRILRPEMFEADPKDPAGVRLTREGLKVFFRAWGEHLEKPLPDAEAPGDGPGGRIVPSALIRRQVDRLAAALRGGEPYRPFQLRS